MRKIFTLGLLAALVFVAGSTRAQALSGAVDFVVLQVTFSDFPNGSRFTGAQTQTHFNDIATLWGKQTSYGSINLTYQFAGPFQVASPSTTYLDAGGGKSSSNAAILQLLKDAVAGSPNTIDWTNVYGVVVLFDDPRAGGFYRGITWPSALAIAPPGGAACGTCSVHVSIVGENPNEDITRSWGRWAHEMGHQLQANPGNPWHPSNYNSDFEQMDTEYPAQSGVFNKQSNMSFPNWLPAGKYKLVNPPQGAAVGLYAQEQPPSSQPNFQAIKAFLTFGGTKVYYLASVRHHVLGDDVATTHGPNGIPDEGVLIERVVEGGDPNVVDSGTARWVNVVNNGPNADTLWHAGDTFHSVADGIFIAVLGKIDADHYQVEVRYADKAGQPDVGLNSWLQPPGNTYETTDIWIDSPANQYDIYRYPMWSDLMGGTVPSGNGDDPAIGQVNRLYARVRNYGAMPAANVVVHFDITDPPGVGINGSNGFVPLGTVTSADFPGLALIAPGKSVDVYFKWTPNFQLTPQQIQQGTFAFHTCVRVRLDHVAGETFFANQDGDGQQENIDYFQAGAQGSPGAPGPPNRGTVRLRNDSLTASKQFALSLLREDLPNSWIAELNGGNPIIDLAPGAVRDIPVTVKQTLTEPVGTHHTFRVLASSQLTLQNTQRPTDLHDEFKVLGGVQFQVAVLRKARLQCKSRGRGIVEGKLSGLGASKDQRIPVEVVGIEQRGRSIGFTRLATYGFVSSESGFFRAVFSSKAAPKRAVCLFAGTTESTSAGSAIFSM